MTGGGSHEALEGSLDLRLDEALQRFGGEIVLATSLGAEDMVLLHALTLAGRRVGVTPRAFFLDTGRLHEETYQLFERVIDRYGDHIELRVLAPDGPALEALVASQGMYGFRASLQARKACCAVRKTHNLPRALAGSRAWITGLRRAQSVTRESMAYEELDAAHGRRVKLNPLIDWAFADVTSYLDAHSVPRSTLHARGFLSIGCAPCTRAVAPGEDERAGRWWWENPEHKECGLHAPGTTSARDGL